MRRKKKKDDVDIIPQILSIEPEAFKQYVIGDETWVVIQVRFDMSPSRRRLDMTLVPLDELQRPLEEM